MASDRSKAIWQISVSLSAYILENAGERVSAQPPILTGFGGRFLELLNRTNEALIAPGNVIEQTRTAIRRGTLVATGIRVSPSPGRTPVLIAPAAILRGRILLLQSALVGTGFRYGDVRVIRRADIPSSLRSTRPNQSRRRSEIQREISALHKLGQLTGLRKQQVFTVRDKLAHAGIQNIGTDKTVERLIRQTLKLKSINKSLTLCAKPTGTHRADSPDA